MLSYLTVAAWISEGLVCCCTSHMDGFWHELRFCFVNLYSCEATCAKCSVRNVLYPCCILVCLRAFWAISHPTLYDMLIHARKRIPKPAERCSVSPTKKLKTTFFRGDSDRLISKRMPKPAFLHHSAIHRRERKDCNQILYIYFYLFIYCTSYYTYYITCCFVYIIFISYHIFVSLSHPQVQ